jgi:hypothetical protein
MVKWYLRPLTLPYCSSEIPFDPTSVLPIFTLPKFWDTIWPYLSSRIPFSPYLNSEIPLYHTSDLRYHFNYPSVLYGIVHPTSVLRYHFAVPSIWDTIFTLPQFWYTFFTLPQFWNTLFTLPQFWDAVSPCLSSGIQFSPYLNSEIPFTLPQFWKRTIIDPTTICTTSHLYSLTRQ